MSTLHTEREAPQRAYDEDEDDQEEYSMPHRYASASGTSAGDREISLGTGTILAIFFALALVCSVFFGFGYTMGRKSTPSVSSAAPSNDPHGHSLGEAFKSFKPAPGGDALPPAQDTAEPASPAPSSKSVVVPAAPIKPAAKKAFDPDAEIVTATNPAPRPAATTHPVTSAPTPPIAASGAIVQIAAVSHQEDADSLLAALKRKGYTVTAHHEPQDKLLHIQLGPYASRKDAEAMRARLLADGYNSILK